MSKPAWAFVIIAVFFTASAAAAQDLPPLSNEYAPGTFPGSSAGLGVSAYPVVTGKPFRALTNSRSVMTMPDGAKRTYESHGILVRDGNGRLLGSAPESPHVPDGPNSDEFTAAGSTVTDPAAKVSFHWDSVSNTVIKAKLLPNQMQPALLNACEAANGASSTGGGYANSRVEQLGPRTIQGIATVGCRATAVIPVWGAAPDTPPNTIVDEWWSSPELRMNLIHTHTESAGNSSLDRLDEIVREEPDPAVFEPPPNYPVQDLDAEREKYEREAVPLIQDGPTPAMLGGPWEVQDPIKGAGTQLGIFLSVTATRDVRAVRGGFVVSGSGKFRPLDVYVYQRVSGKEVGGYYSLAPNDSGAPTGWDGQRLQLKYKGNPRESFQDAFAFDIIFNLPQEIWTGTYTRDGVTNQIRLQRPGAGASGAKSNPLVGLWSLPGTPMGPSTESGGCIQVTQSADGVFAAWYRRSGLPTLGMRGNRGTIDDNSGERWGVTANDGTVTLDEGTYAYTISGTGPIRFVGKLSDDESQLVGKLFSDLLDTPSQQELDAPPTILTRTNGEGCSSKFPAPSNNLE
jgi:hypothetical protein